MSTTSKYQIVEKPKIQLASRYKTNIELVDYLVSEKLDGVRARWNGEAFITRGGIIIKAPAWFLHDFPSEHLDGELWLGRGFFDEVSAIVRRKKAVDSQWQKVTFNVFDLPLSSARFFERYQQMKQLIEETNSPFIRLVVQKELNSNDALYGWLNDVVELGGEGLMLHHKDSLYRHSRSKKLLKLKKVYDAEARVIGYIGGKGKLNGLVGALLMEMPNGVQFKLGSGLSMQLRKQPPEIGASVTYQYYGITKNGKPRFASFWRIKNAD